MRLEDVRRTHVKNLIATVQATQSVQRSQPLAPRTVHRVYEVVRQMFGCALDDELITSTPATLHVRRGELPEKLDKDPAWRNGAVFKGPEVETLISDDRIPVDRRVFYALALLTGARFGEVAGLLWSDYDREARPLGRLHITKQYGGRRTKTGGPRQVPVHPTLARILAEWRMTGWAGAFGRQPKPGDLIVPRMSDGAVRTQAPEWRRWEADLAALGLRHRRPHDLRRTLISLARADGAREDLLKWVTHGSSKSNIMDVYTTPPWEALCAQIACLRIQVLGANVVPLRVAGAAAGPGGDTPGDTAPGGTSFSAVTVGAEGGSRTRMPSRASDFKSPAYACSATPAGEAPIHARPYTQRRRTATSDRRDSVCRSAHRRRQLRAGDLGADVHDAVVAVHQDDAGLVNPSLGLLQLAERGQDDQVTRFVAMRSRAVDADDARIEGPG